MDELRWRAAERAPRRPGCGTGRHDDGVAVLNDRFDDKSGGNEGGNPKIGSHGADSFREIVPSEQKTSSRLSQTQYCKRFCNQALAIYRPDIIIPFGFLSMLIQALIFVWIYDKAFAARSGTLLSRALTYAAVGAILSWSFTTLAVAAQKHHGLGP